MIFKELEDFGGKILSFSLAEVIIKKDSKIYSAYWCSPKYAGEEYCGWIIIEKEFKNVY